MKVSREHHSTSSFPIKFFFKIDRRRYLHSARRTFFLKNEDLVIQKMNVNKLGVNHSTAA